MRFKFLRSEPRDKLIVQILDCDVEFLHTFVKMLCKALDIENLALGMQISKDHTCHSEFQEESIEFWFIYLTLIFIVTHFNHVYVSFLLELFWIALICWCYWLSVWCFMCPNARITMVFWILEMYIGLYPFAHLKLTHINWIRSKYRIILHYCKTYARMELDAFI